MPNELLVPLRTARTVFVIALAALLDVFGRLESFGIVGLFIGPAILAVALTIWREALETPEERAN